MTVMDLYKVLTVNQKVIIRYYEENWTILYKGVAGYIPHYMFDNNIKWVYVSDESDCTLEIMI